MEKRDLRELTAEQMQIQARDAIKQSFDGVYSAMDEAQREHAEEEHEHKFKYRLGVIITIEPLGDECKVSAKAAWTEKHVVEIPAVLVNADPDLFEAAQHKAAAEELKAQVDAAKEVIIETGRATLTVITRRLKVKQDVAQTIMDALEEQGVVGPPTEDGVREILEARE